MKQQFFIIFFIILYSFSACTTDFDVTSDWEEQTVVYGFLDASQPNQYIRISKAFLGDGNAYEMAQNADSLYHQQTISVSLERYKNNNLLSTQTLTKVNASDENIVKEEGIFANNPYILFKANQPLTANFDYKLNINTGKNLVSATTPVIGNFNVIRPISEKEISLISNYTIKFDYTSLAYLYDVDVFINYYEEYMEGNDSIVVLKTIKWDALKNMLSSEHLNNNVIALELSGDSFFDFLSNKLSESANNSQIISRTLESLDIAIHATTEAVYKYNSAILAQSGLTSSQNLVYYTNINNGLGIFASRYSKKVESVFLSPATLDSIACGAKTKQLKFTRDPNNPSSTCP